MGTLLFVSLIFLPLLLYAVLATILAVQFYFSAARRTSTTAIPPDMEGDHPASRFKAKRDLARPLLHRAAAGRLRVGLGKTLAVGDLEVQPLGVEWRKVPVRVGMRLPEETRFPVVRALDDTSKGDFVDPLDRYFNREYIKGESPKPLTLVEAGKLSATTAARRRGEANCRPWWATIRTNHWTPARVPTISSAPTATTTRRNI